VNNFERRLRLLKHPVKSVLDVGAYRGDFARLARQLFPGAYIKCIEGDERQAKYLQEFDADFYLLGKETKQVDFYTLPEETCCTTGSSIYRENTTHYQDPLVLKKWMYSLDDLQQHSTLKSFDLIKLDVQGAELDVLKGGKKYIAKTKPRYLLLETSIQQYNEGAPLAGEVISYLFKRGYNLRDVIDVLYDPEGQLLQVDFLFQYGS
jgi:FkbM family methyltransferase